MLKNIKIGLLFTELFKKIKGEARRGAKLFEPHGENKKCR